ncbi:MAG: catalase family peroxidase [Alphaproteobacteria bacterium]|nr:catalase family peroxidase [Alphaproteobacteria bacterium]
MAAEPTPQQMVDTLHTTFGDHHSRAVHAKGTIVEGSFTANPAARSLSAVALFSAAKVPVTARFSDFTGIPTIPDNVGDANPRGFAVKFKAPGGDFDIVTHSFNGFPTKTSGEFRELLLAIPVSGEGAVKPTALEKFLAAHPIAKTFLTTQKSPESFATSAYFGVNAFKYTKAGSASFVRYRLVPAAGEHYLDAAALAAKSANFLQDDIVQRLAKGPVSFDWFAQIAAKGDAIDDPSVAWPGGRKLVKLGTITLTKVVADTGTDHQLLFLPANMPDGIEAADPMLGIRNNAYPISFSHRQ